MIARLGTLLRTYRDAPPSKLDLYVALFCITTGLATLQRIVGHQKAAIAEGNRDLAQLYGRIGDQQQRLIALREETARVENERTPYPAPEDLDPLGRGDQLVDEHQAAEGLAQP